MKLHLGCGSNTFAGWLNIDFEQVQTQHQFLRHGLTRPLPFSSGSVDFVFTEHFLEHLTRDQGVSLLRDCHRVLRPGGVIRIVVPSLEHLVKKYIAKDLNWGGTGGWEPKTPAQMMNEGMRSWSHQFMYDMPELVMVLRESGFQDHVITSPIYRQSPHKPLWDLETRPEISDLRIEAVKS